MGGNRAVGGSNWPPRTLIGALGPGDLDAILAVGFQRTFPARQVLIHEGDSTTDMFIVLDGWVKVIGNSATGREVLLAIRAAGDAVGELAALDNSPRSASVVAVTKVTALVIPQRQFLSMVAARPGVALALASANGAKVRLATRYRIDLSGAPVLQRVARVLDYLVESYGTPCPAGLRIEAPLTRSDLAAMVGAAEPSLYRAIAYLRSRNALVKRDRRYVVQDLAVLQKISRGVDPESI
jgi:CRP/FNR family transcriptional regulator, cyclic AMP receptor protein